jgi:hypothetical protein
MLGVLMAAGSAFAAGLSAAWILQAARTRDSTASPEVRALEALKTGSERSSIAEATAPCAPESEILPSAHDVQQTGELLPLPYQPFDGPLV